MSYSPHVPVDSNTSSQVEMALYEVKADFTMHEFDFGNRLDFYVQKVNPLGQVCTVRTNMSSYTESAPQVPAIVYGGTPVPAAQIPSPDSAIIRDSSVILEFLSEVYPEAQLLPKDPVERAHVRFFMEIVNTRFAKVAESVPAGTGSTFKDLFDTVDLLQPLIKGAYVAGDQFTIADCAFAPHFGKLELVLSNDIGKYPVGEGKAAWEKLSTDPKYSKLWAYWVNLKKRDSFVKSWYQVCCPAFAQLEG